jgi:8-oxo-dGTP pyrophosphatase MutT (NUDIX family)
MTVIPRPASTVVLINQMAKVYLTKRPKTMKFFGGFYVFPGGAVEEDDYNLGKQYDTRLEERDQAFFAAAIRELFEEAGILLCKENTLAFMHDSDLEYRRKLITGELSFRQFLKQENITLDFESLRHFGHLITPEGKPIRFDTRFFLAKLPDGQIPKPDLFEIEEASWFSPQEALTAYKNNEILLGPPTILALETIKHYLNGSPLVMPELKL